MNRAFDVITALDTCVDLIVTGPDVVPEFNQTEKLVDDYAFLMGGSNCIFACQSAKLGLRTAGVGVCGDDSMGELVLRNLKDSGVDVSHVRVSPDFKTGLGIAFVKPDDRAIMTYLGSINPPDLHERLTLLLPQCRHLHIGSYFLMTRLRGHYASVARMAKENGLSVSLDVNWDPENLWDIGDVLPFADILLPNANEAKAMTGCHDLGAAAEKLLETVRIVVIKDGKEGARVYAKDACFEAKAEATDVVDAIGAGDSFDAGFIYGYLNGLPLARCLQIGVACGTASTRARGGTAAQLSRRQLDASLTLPGNH